MTEKTEPEILAAGGVVWRRADHGGREFAVIYRPKYDDWTLPKGKLDPGETFEQAALREVEEETGLRTRLGRRLGDTEYRDRHNRPKLVQWWAMEAESGEFKPNDEVSELVWLSPEEARARLQYPRDRELIAEVESSR
jgi:8-oxo-dGTP pyrophosphatase MutT (NUDIX family)